MKQPKHLNPQSPIPLYRQLAETLARGIREGEFPPEGRIPSEHDLAAMFGIGRPTVRQATDYLIRKGLLVRRRGSGTFVREAPPEVDLFSLGGTLSAFQKEGIGVETELLAPLRKIQVPLDGGNPFSGGDAFFLGRLSKVAGAPVLLEEMYLSAPLFPGIDALDLVGKSLSRIIEDTFFLRPVGGRQTFGVGDPGPERAKLLGISQETPVLLVKRVLNFPGAAGALYAELFCLTDRFLFSQTIEGALHENERLL